MASSRRQGIRDIYQDLAEIDCLLLGLVLFVLSPVAPGSNCTMQDAKGSIEGPFLCLINFNYSTAGEYATNIFKLVSWNKPAPLWGGIISLSGRNRKN